MLAQFSTPKGITVEVNSSYWPNITDLPTVVKGVIQQWINKGAKTLRIEWTEADGTKAYDCEKLDMLLLEKHEFKLLLGARGEALRLRGQAARDFEEAQPKRKVTIPYKDGAIQREQVWTVEPNPEAIVEDARKEGRSKPALARRKDEVDSPFKMWYNGAVSQKWLNYMELYFNQRLDGKTHIHRKTTRGEIVRFLSMMGAVALRPAVPVRKMWQRLKGPKDIYAPAQLGMYGIGINRFELLEKLLGECYPLEEVGLDESDPWRYSRLPVECYNNHMDDVFSPGWNTGPDESMSAWTGAEGTRPHECPKVMFVERKPEPLGCELEDAADAQTGAIFRIEINEGKLRMCEKKYFAEYGATTACSLRLSEKLHGSKRCWGGDSWFMSVTSVETLLEHGLYGYGDVKTQTTRYPTQELIDLVGPNSGDWAVMTTVVSGGHLIYAIGHRRGGTVHTYISSHGTSIAGIPQAHKDDVEALGMRAVPRPCPKVLNDWTAQQPQIDKRNRERQHMLAMEKRFVTRNFCFRLATTILGITFTTAKCFYDFFVGDYGGTFLEFVHELCYDGLINDIDGPNQFSKSNSAPDSGAGSSTMPGSQSPFQSPSKAKSLHKVCRVPDILGWKGVAQPKCSVCRKSTTRCCSACSNGDKIFAVCNPVKGVCFDQHVADPTNAKWRARVSTGPQGKRKAGPPGSAESSKTTAGKKARHGKGSRSGQVPTWDAARGSHEPRAAPRARAQDSSEFESESD